MVDDETGKTSLIDSYGIKKTEKTPANDSFVELPTDRNEETAKQHINTFVAEILKMVISYFKLLFSLI